MIENTNEMYNPRLNPLQKELVRELRTHLIWGDHNLDGGRANRIYEIEKDIEGLQL
jgi:hypothetical protein